MGRVELCPHHIQGVPGDHWHAAEDTGEGQALGFGLDQIDEHDAQTGHQQAASWRQKKGGEEI